MDSKESDQQTKSSKEDALAGKKPAVIINVYRTGEFTSEMSREEDARPTNLQELVSVAGGISLACQMGLQKLILLLNLSHKISVEQAKSAEPPPEEESPLIVPFAGRA